MEFEARLNQLTETFEKKHLEVLEKISQITLSSHASMNSTEHEVRNVVKLDFYNVMNWIDFQCRLWLVCNI
jgi:hypothetical protein